MENTLVTPRVQKLLVILGMSIIAGVLFDYFFYGKLPGISFPIYISLGVAGLAIVTKGFKKARQNLWLILPTIFFAAMVAVRANHSLTALNIIVSFFCLFLMIEGLSGEKITGFLYKDYIAAFLVTPLNFLGNIFEYLGELLNFKSIIPKSKILSQIFKGVMMAIPVLLLFVVLFASADAIFNQMVQNIFHFNVDPESFLRIIMAVGIALLASGMLYFAQNERPKEIAAPEEPLVKKPLNTVQVSVFLGLINGLFLLFICIQLTYLFGGQQNISVEGYTYAEYARKGFFELIVVAVCSYLIILSSEKTVEKKDQKHTTAFKVLSSMLIIQVLMIMVAAFMRLSLYEEAYGFTQLRFYSHAFTVWLGIVFVFFLIKIFVKQQQSLHIFESFVMSLVFLGIINFINPDAFIARKNIDRIGKPSVVELDNEYLSNLSDDAIPEILTLLQNPDSAIRSSNAFKLLEIKKERTKNHSQYDQWPSWNFSRNTATELLNSRATNLEELSRGYHPEANDVIL